MAKPRLKQSSNSRGGLNLDPASVEKFKKKLEELQNAVRREIVEKALQAGGGVIHDAAENKAPGPHIEVEVMTGAELMKGWKSAAAQGINAKDMYAVIGPDKEHWYYRFSEYGTKSHGVRRRKRTVKEISARMGASREQRRSIKKSFAGKRPAMVFEINGRLIFTRRVRGVAAKPFMRPAIDSNGNAAVRELGDVLANEIEQVARG